MGSTILIILSLFFIFLSIGAFVVAKKAKNNGNEKEYRIFKIAFVILLCLGLAVGPIFRIIYGNISNDGYVSSGSQSSSSSSETRFTNKYGTPTTECYISGCDNYIAKSGNTNCCTYHSNRCGNCNCYIDSDAMFCMDCIEDALRN